MMNEQHVSWHNADKFVWKEMKKEFKQFIGDLGFKYKDSWKAKDFRVDYASEEENLLLTIIWEKERLVIRLQGPSSTVEEELDAFLISFDFLKSVVH